MRAVPKSWVGKVGLAAGSALVLLAAFHVALLDGVDGFLWSLFIEAPTEYAAGYSDHGFRRVRSGDAQTAVLRELGEPLSKQIVERSMWPRPVEYWQYSRSPQHGSHYRRQILFDTDGHVIEKHSFLDVD